MRKVFLRPALAIIFGFIGLVVARSGTPPEIFDIVGDYFLIVAFLAFTTFGFILPDIVVLAGNAGITALAKQISEYISRPSSRPINVPRWSFRRGRKPPKYVNPIIVDTSALIDGRIVELSKSGFVFGTYLVIPSVIGELHRLADSADDNKRVRGRRGLDSLAAIQKAKKIKVEILGSEPRDKDVDYKLIALAKKQKGKIMTVDFNLNKVASVRGVDVLNLNELASSLKTQVLPRDVFKIKVSSVGREKGQGVGYLEDGTMVVIEDAASLQGKSVEVMVERVLATAAGNMIFTKVVK